MAKVFKLIRMNAVGPQQEAQLNDAMKDAEFVGMAAFGPGIVILVRQEETEKIEAKAAVTVTLVDANLEQD